MGVIGEDKPPTCARYGSFHSTTTMSIHMLLCRLRLWPRLLSSDLHRFDVSSAEFLSIPPSARYSCFRRTSITHLSSKLYAALVIWAVTD
jgi:hypothetical protein